MAGRRLVVDASVARTAGGLGATHPSARRCGDFLRCMLDTTHVAVFSREIAEEWGNPQTPSARRWRRSMIARRRIVWLKVVTNQGLRDELDRCSVSGRQRQAMQHDMLLVEAALATDRVVVSLDEEVRGLFVQNLSRMRALADIAWVNPDRDEEEAIPWLRRGAKAEKKRMLGYAQQES